MLCACDLERAWCRSAVRLFLFCGSGHMDILVEQAERQPGVGLSRILLQTV